MICANDLSENLTSLNKFAHVGLGMSSVNIRKDIFDSESKTLFIAGTFKKPYRIIEFGVDNNSIKMSRVKKMKIKQLHV